MSSLEPYPQMKDSGKEWMETIPAHWRLDKIKRLARPGTKTFVDGDWIESPFITSGGVRTIQTGNIGVGAYREKGFPIRQRRYIRELWMYGGHAWRRSDLSIGAPVARACRAPDLGTRMITSVDVCILKTDGAAANAAFIVYALSSRYYLDWVGSLVRGSTRDRVSRTMLGSFVLPTPPLPEQNSIARFLDHADRRIQRYIRAKEKLIALLEEQKQVLIHDAVTGRIDVRTGRAHPEHKESRAERVGRIPKDWGLVSLRQIASKFGSGVTPRGGSAVYSDTGILFLRSQNVHFDGIRLDGVARISDEIHASLAGTHVKPGDVLLNITGASIGRVCAVPEEFEDANVSQHVCIIRPRQERVLPEFLASYLSTSAIQREIQVEQNGASVKGSRYGVFVASKCRCQP